MKSSNTKPPQIVVEEKYASEKVTVEDVVQAIQRRPGSELYLSPTSTSNEETKSHTVGSRWSMMKSAIGIQKPRGSIYTGVTQHNDYQRILDEWIRICASQGTPLAQLTKISDEFKKRMNREGTHEAKEKLNFSSCDLNDHHLIALSVVLAQNPKIAFLDFSENNEINEVGVQAFNNLVICQLEAAKLLANDPTLIKATLINEIKWSKKQQKFVTPEVLQALDDLRVVNARIMIKNSFQSIGNPAVIDDEVNRKMWKKVVRRDSAVRLSIKQSLEYDTLENQLIIGMQENNLLPNPKKDNTRASIFGSRGSFFGGSTPGASPAQRQSVFSNFSSPALTPQNSVQKSSAAKSLFADVDDDKQDGKKEEPDNNRKISYALNGADEKLNESELKKNEVISVRNSEQELRLLREEEERKRLAQEELERKEKAEEEERLRLRVEEERKLRKLQEEQTLRLKKEEEERLRRQKAEEARLRKQREEEERLRKQEEEEERLRKLKEEEERLRKQQQEEEERLLKEIEQEQERLRIQQEEEERLRKEQQEEEDERLRKMIEEEEERLRLEKEEEERLHKQQQEEEEERLRKEQEEIEEMQRLEAEERLRLRLQYEEEQSKLEAERLQKLKEEEEKQQLENTPSRSHDEIDIEFAVSDDTNAPISAIKASESEFEDGHGRRQSVDQSFDFISEIAESDLHSDFEREDSQQHIEEDRDTTTDAIAIEDHDEQNVGEQSDLEQSHMNEEDHDAHLVDTKENEVTREEEHHTTVSNSSEFYDNFQAETSGFAAVSRTADSGEDFLLRAASSHDSRYEHLELTELHLIHELVSTSEVEEVVTPNILGIVEAKENENQEPYQEPPAMIAPQLSNSSEKESSHKNSSSYDTTDPADSVVKNSHDSLDEKHHEDGEESLHEKGIEEDEEEGAVKDEDPCEESKAYESWQIDLDAHSDSELLDTDADNDGYDNYKPAEYEDVHFDYDMIHRKESEFDEFPPISEIILQTRSNLDTSAFSATNPLYGTRSIDEETLTENPVQDEERQNDSVTSVEFDERDTSSQGYSDAMELEENEDVLQCAQVLETSDLPRCLNLTNTQRTDSNINWNKYLTSDQFEKVRILILKDNFFTDLESLRLRECFPKLRELDFTRNYLSGELTTKVFSSRLRKLDLSRNQISNIKGLIYCKRLEELNVSHNRIRFLDPLPQTLTVLDISCNWIDSATTFRALSRNHRLHEIDISGNNIATIKNIEGTIKTLVPGLLKSTIIYDRMLVKRRTSPRFKIGSPPKGNKNNNHTPSAQVSPSSIVVNAKESPGSSNYASPNKDESFLFHHSMHVNPRLEEASKALRSNETERQHAERQAYLKRAKEFSGKVREQQQQQHTLKKTNDHSSRASTPSLIPIAKGKFSAQNNNKQNPALQSAPSFMSEITASSTTTAQSKLKKGSFMSESFISVQSYQTGRTGITGTSAAPSLSVGGTHASSVVRRQSNSSATSVKSSGGLNYQGSTHKVNGNKIVNHWLTKTQNRLNRCVSIFTMITELAKTELLLSSTTHYGLLQEWAKVGFFDLNPAVCSFTPLVKPEFLARENIIEMDDDYCEVPIVDIECAEKLWNELNDFHSLFIQIYMALEISILHQVNFRALFEPIMKKKIGSRVNERLNHVYEFSDDEERIFTAY